MSLWSRVFQERRRVMLPLAALIVANVAVLALGVFPLSQNVSGLEADAANAGANLLRARLVEKQAKDASASKQRADQELKKFYEEILPATPRAAQRVMSFLERTAEQSGLEFRNSSLDWSEVKDSPLLRMSGKVTLSGEYSNIRKFLYAVETAQEFVIIERVGLTQASDLRSANSGRLEVTLDIATFYLGTPVGASSR